MLFYSETTKVFIQRVREEIRSLFFLEIENKLPVKLNRDRISYFGTTYPISIVVFEDNQRHGYFDSRLYEIGISKKLMYSAFDDVLRNIIRHELAHYLAYIIDENSLGHGEKFHTLCQKLGWGKNVFSAYSNIENDNQQISEKSVKNSELLLKVKKLLALSSSDNVHESEIATMKANKLLLDYNLNKINLNAINEREICVVRVLESTRTNEKMVTIAAILKAFFVSSIFNHGKNCIYLEIIGNSENVEIAEYVAHFLDNELDRLWVETQKKNPHLRGLVAKNSFLRGIAAGHLQKIEEATRTTTTSTQSRDLINLKNALKEDLNFVYNRLTSSSREIKNNHEAMGAGIKAGLNLSIKPGIKNQSSEVLYLN